MVAMSTLTSARCCVRHAPWTCLAWMPMSGASTCRHSADHPPTLLSTQVRTHVCFAVWLWLWLAAHTEGEKVFCKGCKRAGMPQPGQPGSQRRALPCKHVSRLYDVQAAAIDLSPGRVPVAVLLLLCLCLHVLCCCTHSPAGPSRPYHGPGPAPRRPLDPRLHDTQEACVSHLHLL